MLPLKLQECAKAVSKRHTEKLAFFQTSTEHSRELGGSSSIPRGASTLRHPTISTQYLLFQCPSDLPSLMSCAQHNPECFKHKAGTVLQTKQAVDQKFCNTEKAERRNIGCRAVTQHRLPERDIYLFGVFDHFYPHPGAGTASRNSGFMGLGVPAPVFLDTDYMTLPLYCFASFQCAMGFRVV